MLPLPWLVLTDRSQAELRVRRVITSELRHRCGRALALLAGILIATTAFTVLTGASDTQRLSVRATVTAHFRTEYDVLVRPRGSRTALEQRRGLVRPGALSGIFGGITLAQWQTVLHTPGVAVAAPIAVIGYALPQVEVPVDLTRDLPRHGRALYRVRIERVTDRGLTHQPDAALYVYVTPRPFLPNPPSYLIASPSQYAPKEVLAGGTDQPVCAQGLSPNSPWDLSVRGGALAPGNVDCWSRRTGLGNPGYPGISFGPLPHGHVGALIPAYLPFVIAAIDPTQEARLDHLNRAINSGRYLRATDHPPQSNPNVPVLAPSQPYVDETINATIERLPRHAAERFAQTPPLLGGQLQAYLARQPGRIIGPMTIGSHRQQQAALAELRSGAPPLVFNYWTVGPTQYQTDAGGTLAPVAVRNPPTVWLGSSAYFPAPLSAQDRQFRRLSGHIGAPQLNQQVSAVRSVGVFDPAKLAGFTSNSDPSLDAYRSPALQGADRRSRRLLRNQPLLPNGNLAGYPTQPPLMLTTLRSLPALEGESYAPNSGRAPISAIRVRVAGVHGIDPISRERVRLAAQRIATRTGLDVDLTVGSSPAPLTVALPAGRFGRPALKLTEPWIKKGVALAILAAVDKKSLVLFALILVVCGLFVTNAAGAAVRARRSELGVLACLGWSAPKLFSIMIGEVATIGLSAGVIGAVLAVPVAAAAGIHGSPARAAVAIPAALALALAAGVVPAIRAARAQPIAAVRPAVLESHRAFHPRGVGQLALINAIRVPGRTALAVTSLGVGVCAFTLLLSATLAFHNVLVGTLLGGAVSVEVRGSDYVAVISITTLGLAAVADVLYLNLLDRAGELATLRAAGWEEATLMRLIATEGLWLGAVGSLAGAAVGLTAAATFAGALPTTLVLTSLLAAAAGTLLAAIAAVAPAVWLRRLPALPLLAGE